MTKEFNIHGMVVTVDQETRETVVGDILTVIPEMVLVGNEKPCPSKMKTKADPIKEHCLLLKMSEFEYVFIGKESYKFSAENEIVSTIFGTVDKPFVWDKSGNMYLLCEGIVISRFTDDPYFYYENRPPIIGNYTNYTLGKYTDFTIDGYPEELCWKPDRSITANFGFKEMTIKKSGKTVPFTGGIMNSIFDDYGSLYGIKKMKKKRSL